MEGLKALDPNRPIREADMRSALAHVRYGPEADICGAKLMSALHPKADMCGTSKDIR
jgi:hypothetical protein